MKKLCLIGLTLLVVGCGQLEGGLNSLNLSPTASADGARLENAVGSVVIPAGAVTGGSIVTLRAPQLLPALKGAQALASIHINLGNSELQSPIQVSFSGVPKAEGLGILAWIEGAERYFPIEAQGLTGTLQLATGQAPFAAADQDGRDIHFVLANFEASPAYQVWNTYNGYAFEKNGQSQVQMRQFVVGGAVQGTLPTLGGRPGGT